jgi:hypothetical protein
MAETELVQPEVEIVPHDEVQTLFDQVDAQLDRPFKARFPVKPFDEIHRRHTNEWIAFLPRELGGPLGVVTARLLAHAADRDTLDAQLRPLRQRYPTLSPSIWFAGTSLVPERP